MLDENTLYTTLSDLPLYNWVEIATTSNLKWLIKSGSDISEAELSETYDLLLAEYQSLIKDTKAAHEHNLRVTYAKLANRIDHITIAVTALREHGRDESLILILQTPQPHGLGFERLTYDDLERDLKLTENYLKMDIVKLEQAKNQLEKMVKTASVEGGNAKGMFYEQIGALSKWLQFGINPRETSVMQYIAYLNMLDAEIRANRNRVTRN
jgi:ribosomal protein S6